MANGGRAIGWDTLPAVRAMRLTWSLAPVPLRAGTGWAGGTGSTRQGREHGNGSHAQDLGVCSHVGLTELKIDQFGGGNRTAILRYLGATQGRAKMASSCEQANH